MSSRAREIREFCDRVLDDPARGAADLERIGEGPPSAPIFPALEKFLPDVADPDLALVHLERYCRESDPPTDPEVLQILLTLFGFSPYLAESLLADRACLPALHRARRQGPWEAEDYRGDLARRLRIQHGSEPWGVLRAYRRWINLRVALRDLQKRASLAEVTREISAAADALIQAAFEIVMNGLKLEYGTPQSYDESGRIVESTMVVIALGKLGGRELNYSSDIDLLFIYSTDGETSGLSGRPQTQISNKEFFTRAAQELARGLGQISAEGQVFRVDCRLRPGGRDGDLVSPLQGAQVYYHTWARPWERQALIKARACAGDERLGGRFASAIEDVVYPRPADRSVADGIRLMKDRIDADLARRGQGALNLKLGVGGIREIEFCVQALQIVHGGEDPWVRGPNTLLAMHRLTDKGHLSVPEYGALSAAYTFLREAEHRLQIHRNLQRSALPAHPRGVRILARSMGYRDSSHRQEAAAFLADLDAHRGAVRAIYDDALGRLAQPRLEESPGPDPFLDPLPDAAVVARLGEAGLAGTESLLGAIRAIGRLLAGPAVAAEVRRLFRRLSPDLVAHLTQVENPVRALRNFERFLASLALEPGGLAGLLQRREIVSPLIRLFGGSLLLSSTLIHRPALVLEQGFGQSLAHERDVKAHLERILRDVGADTDVDALTGRLRVYQRKQLLYTGLKDLNGQAGPAGVGRALSDLAEAIVRAAVVRAAHATGWPSSEPTSDCAVPGFIVVALGKLGYREIDYATDLDLLFLYEDEGRAIAERHAAANRLAGLVMEMLTSMTREGSLYAVDNRLRPYGGEGELAQSVARWREYFESQARVWEMQAFLKARPVAGDLAAGRTAVEQIEALVFKRAAGADLGREVAQTKEKLERQAALRPGVDIKNGPGGLTAIQFAIQYLQLRHGIASPTHKRTTRVLATLRAAGALDEEAYRTFFTGYRFLRRLEHRIRLIHGRALSSLPASGDALEELARSMGGAQDAGKASGRLLEEVALRMAQIEETYRRVIERSPRVESVGV